MREGGSGGERGKRGRACPCPGRPPPDRCPIVASEECTVPDTQKRRGPDLVGVIGLAIIVGILAGAYFGSSPWLHAVDELPGLHRLGPDHRLLSRGAPTPRRGR